VQKQLNWNKIFLDPILKEFCYCTAIALRGKSASSYFEIIAIKVCKSANINVQKCIQYLIFDID
jgi:hypothetical protein